MKSWDSQVCAVVDGLEQFEVATGPGGVTGAVFGVLIWDGCACIGILE